MLPSCILTLQDNKSFFQWKSSNMNNFAPNVWKNDAASKFKNFTVYAHVLHMESLNMSHLCTPH